MIPYQKEKTENAICFFAKEHQKKARKPLHQTFLYKYLAFSDFTSLKETGEPALGLSYRAMERGPVPIDLYEKRETYSSPLAKFVKEDRGGIMVIAKKEPDLDYFSPYEIELMSRLIEIYASSYIPTRLVSDASHQEIAAWKRTWKTKPNGLIDYASEFHSGSACVLEGKVPYTEEHFLVSSTLDSLEK
jgi:hypothetical protein